MFKRIFGKKDEARSEVPNLEVVCPHTVLIAAWDNADDMAKRRRQVGSPVRVATKSSLLLRLKVFAARRRPD